MPPTITCLLSHQCSDQAHTLAKILKSALQDANIDLLIDPFRFGDDVQTRIDSFDFDSLLFLSSPESLASRFCQRELSAARRRSIPIFVAVLAGDVPKIMKRRIYWSLPASDSGQFTSDAQNLGKEIRARVSLLRNLRELNTECPADKTRDAAQTIALDIDSSLVAEIVSLLARRYVQMKDPTTRFWLALGLGSAGTAKAAKLLNNLPKEDHPYALEGIRQAQAMITFGN